MKNFLLLITFIFTLSVLAFGQKDSKLSTDEFLSKHLASIGSKEAIAAAKSRVIIGNGSISSKVGFSGQLNGPAQFASDGDKVLFAIVFDSTTYPYEKVGYDGQRVSIGLPVAGKRTILGDFFKSQGILFTRGLFGGSLSSGWALLNLDAKKAKLELSGIKEVDNQKLYKVKYNSSDNKDLTISLYFDTETFRHVRSEYEFSIEQRMTSSSIKTGDQNVRRYKLVEKFSDFKIEGQLTLPHSYEINLVSQGENGTATADWKMVFSQFVFNETLDAKVFNVS